VGEPLPADLREDRTTTTAAAVPRKTDSHASFEAAVKAADRLRPKGSSDPAITRVISGRISAWPTAGPTRRVLATFIDLTLAMMAAGTALLLMMQNIVPNDADPFALLFGTMLLTLWFNDGVIPLIWGGSVGKLLVLVVVHHADGGEIGIARTLIRALCKWLLIPGWLIGGFDTQERTLHDLLCNTLVVRGRRRTGK
jgi:uncharacterized RDD family membrane protein YckC